MADEMATGGSFGSPDPALMFIACILAFVFSIFQYYISDRPKNEKKKRLEEGKPKSNYSLAEHSKQFNKKEVVRVDDNVYCAIGFGLANCILIEGEDGCVLIDTLEAYEAAREVKQVFEEQFGLGGKNKPIKAIILTHFHGDHTYGFDIFKEAYPDAKVYAHSTFQKEFDSLMNARIQITYVRGAYQLGNALPDEHQENSGIGYRFKSKIPPLPASYLVVPTNTFEKRLDIDPVKGVHLELHHAPGETNDQIVIWWPQKRMLFPADNIYRAFPNLYAIRGTSARDTTYWIKAIDLMRSLKPNILVPQHTRPIAGEDAIMDILTAYRDGIQFVRDQTIRYMNKGLLPDEITQVVKLPPHLQEHPYLQQFYGIVEWSCKAVFNHYMGWFSGKASELHPLPPKEAAKELVYLGGGPKLLLEKATSAFDAKKFQWSLQLCDALIETNNLLKEAKSLKIRCLRKLAEGETSANGRNYYLTSAMVTEDGSIPALTVAHPAVKQRIQIASLQDIFATLTLMLDAEKTFDVTESVYFNFTDVDEHFVLKLRRGVLEVLEGKPEDEEIFDLKVTTSSALWREILFKDRSALVANMTRGIKCEPNIQSLGCFMKYFETIIEK